MKLQKFTCAAVLSALVLGAVAPTALAAELLNCTRESWAKGDCSARACSHIGCNLIVPVFMVHKLWTHCLTQFKVYSLHFTDFMGVAGNVV